MAHSKSMALFLSSVKVESQVFLFQGLESTFENAVDDYLTDCEKLGRYPSKPYKGSFNVRVGSDLHKKALIAAKEKT